MGHRQAKTHTEVQEGRLLAPQVLHISRVNYRPFIAGTISTPRVESSSFSELINSSYKIEFIANISRESYWTGQAIEYAAEHSIAFGGLGDLFSAVNFREPYLYVNKEFEFVERSLLQHTKVTTIDRIHDRKYVVNRQSLKSITVVLLNEYELTADRVRTARSRYGPFEAIVVTNPNARPTSLAIEAAASMDVRIYKWGQFLSRLNKR
jgi:hypothetical protein